MSSQCQTVSSLFTVRVSKAFTMGQNVVLGLQRSIQRRNEQCSINENTNEIPKKYIQNIGLNGHFIILNLCI